MQYASKLYGQDQIAGTAENDSSDAEEGDIEAEIRKEIDDIRKPTVAPLFTSVKLDTQCCKINDQPPPWALADVANQYCFSKHAHLLSLFHLCKRYAKTLQMVLDRKVAVS